MKPRTIRYYIREAFRSIIVNRLMSVASIFTVASCIFIVSMFYILGSNVDFLMHQLGEQVGLSVFIDENLDAAGQLRLEGLIRAIPQVADLEYIPRAEALEQWRERLGETLTQGFERDNPFRDAFTIELVNLAYQDDVIRALENLRPDGIGTISYAGATAEILSTIASVVQIISAAFILILGIISIIIITNTIRITVNARRTEINIMKYVGATDWFIRWPFIIEGVLIGLIGGAIPSLIIWLGYSRVLEMVSGMPELAFMYFLPAESILPYLFPFALALGTIIGLVGSSVSVRRHLQV